METDSAGDLVLEARTRSRLSQRALGRIAGMPQSAVSAYENGAKEPSLPVLRRLLAAAGFDLATELVARPPHWSAFEGPVGRRVQSARSELRTYLVRAGFDAPEVFGSVSRGDDHDDSDLDVLVDVPEGLGLVGLSAARRRATEIAGVPVDLVPRTGLRADVRASVERDLVPL